MTKEQALSEIDRLSAALVEAKARIAFLEEQPLFSSRMKIERLAPATGLNGAPVSFGWKVGWVADQLVETRAKLEEARLALAMRPTLEIHITSEGEARALLDLLQVPK
jgi:hypothetical protein